MIGVGRARPALETELIESMIDHDMAGLVLVSPASDPKRHTARCTKAIPIVVIGYHQPAETTFDTVNGDDRPGPRWRSTRASRGGIATSASCPSRMASGIKRRLGT